MSLLGPFAEDAVYAYGADSADETAARTIVSGSAAIASVLSADTASQTQVLVSVERGRDRLFEGRALDAATGEPTATVAAAVQLDAAGAIIRAVSFRSAPVEPSPTWGAPPGVAVDVAPVLDAYFTRLEAGDADGAAACFSEDVLYSHPPYAPGQARVEYRGRAELREGFGHRGRRPWRHRVLVAIQDGFDCILEGDVGGLDGGGRGGFLSSLSLDADGRILRYCSFYTSPAVPRR